MVQEMFAPSFNEIVNEQNYDIVMKKNRQKKSQANSIQRQICSYNLFVYCKKSLVVIIIDGESLI
ncbi:MAG: hypothetical protein DCC43_01680 [Candidatus Brocadia sp.]|jgi:hypothetical protein|uniref:Uncharacterized protein n=1 Tax=Candidatus Brocadia fulgida TaxID=380242 RepID=A0A0M2UY30_9BACT|nr:MAG: hypothetical protein BROFUL_01425 [Candidatus Brocadia fulgida]MCC6325861.1 hypothetical protein [Candidatus Brocadia sp.]MCE7910392.1 hypothetical protein [Candidatus Brocadia sp. AMX3]OQZ02600.1 MAG: hypothetical protein B6D35_00765 [Candidatus Brocadia sp. UTAMX2]MBV6517892.1 hypothetical protein [Candidatus Brocadia fulgida]